MVNNLIFFPTDKFANFLLSNAFGEFFLSYFEGGKKKENILTSVKASELLRLSKKLSKAMSL